ncbi:hypothetical protein [Methanofollis fontis]|uniref:Uncharacterized protein n=1 Tax=Methanofollis fontis TaxID=2052832 RepID=A0A483CVX8_9EURY|nr:hypothetical protein [Methanofollis fontis]TAJ45681.1 hypothetical protein CUJ86_02905 [Methanofollis fontis]
MTDQKYQSGMMKTVEAILDDARNRSMENLERDLTGLGFVQIGADPAAVAMEHRGEELYLEMELDDAGVVHSYILIPFEEKKQKQERFRW